VLDVHVEEEAVLAAAHGDQVAWLQFVMCFVGLFLSCNCVYELFLQRRNRPRLMAEFDVHVEEEAVLAASHCHKVA